MREPVQAFRAAIEAALGHAPVVIEPGALQRSGTKEWPVQRRCDTAAWCKLFADLRGGVFGDWRTGVSESWQAERDGPLTRQQRVDVARQIAQAAAERERRQRQQWAVHAGRIARLWGQCIPPVSGDPVMLYLERRGFGDLRKLPACLRLHRALPYWHVGHNLGTYPAMVAPLMLGGRVVALHRTYLTADGRKADVPTVKKLTVTAGPLVGACIPLHEAQRGVIGIAEGIETALAAWLASGIPTVAAYSAGNLAAWQWPVSAQRLAIFADNDRAGREAADALRAHAFSAGIGCEVLTPSDDGADWCDVWAQRGAAAIEGVAA